MQITSKFTIAVHIITAIDFFKDTRKVTSTFLSKSVGANPVIVRNIMGDLKEAGIIDISQGKSGILLSKDLKDISFYDVYKAIDCINEEGLFHVHENPDADCEVVRNIHKAVSPKLSEIQQAMENKLKSITLDEAVKETRKLILAEKETNQVL